MFLPSSLLLPLPLLSLPLLPLLLTASDINAPDRRDSTKYRTPYAPWGGFTNGYEGNLRAFLIKAQQSLSGNGNKTPLPAIPASLLRPFQQGGSPPTAATRPAAAAAPAGGTPWLSSYSSQPQLLSPAHASSTSSPYSAANSSATTSPRFSSSSSSSSTPLHPAIRPQYSSPFQQIPPQSALSVQQQQQQQQQRHSTPGTNHLGPWKATPNRPSPSPTVARQTSFTRQSHSPIPLPPYVRAAARPPASAASTAPGSKKVPAPTQPHRSHQETGVAVAATETTPPVGSPLAQAPANRDPPTISSTSQAAGGEGIPAAEQAVPDLPDVPAEAMLLVEQMVAKLRRASEREVVA
ncbi:hypothetical protein VTK73DRAFT_10071 [Phialemonium thermophilum]|uniref:Uncharacterized protein n=1 Tax=Phialemonium thermophilum TaxID=223376 RepID=A0ABR3VYR7_9PEZI